MACSKRISLVIRELRACGAIPLCDVRVDECREIKSGEYIALRIVCGEWATIYIREIWINDKLIKYAYQLTINNEPVLRYDNTPHYPGIPTYPHHRHYKGKVYPAVNHELKDFLREAMTIMKNATKTPEND